MRSSPLRFSKQELDLKAIVLGLAFVVMWSSAFTSAKVLVQYSPPIYILAVRFLISGTLGIILAFALGQKINFSKNEWKVIGIFGVCQNSIYLGLNFSAMQWVDAGIGAVIASTLPILVVTISIMFCNEKINRIAFLGLMIGDI